MKVLSLADLDRIRFQAKAARWHDGSGAKAGEITS